MKWKLAYLSCALCFLETACIVPADLDEDGGDAPGTGGGMIDDGPSLAGGTFSASGGTIGTLTGGVFGGGGDITASGGQASGGDAATGGEFSTGGDSSSGGDASSGGDTSTGGETSSGGASSGGASSGGAASGGASSGGASSGGAASGGASSGGASSGGASSGGATSDDSVVWLYQHCGYGGYVVALEEGDYSTADLVALGGVNNDASSIEVSPGYEVVLFDGDNQTGSFILLSADTTCMTAQSFNDKVSSIRVQPAGTGTGGSGSGGAGSGGAGSGGSGTGGEGGDGDCRIMLGDVPVCCTPVGTQRTNVDEVVLLLNQYRVSLGLSALAVDDALEEAMQGHCQHMDEADFFSHSSPVAAIESPWARAEYCGTSADGENIAAGYQTPAQVMEGWKNSSGHDSNMRGNHTVVGVGEYNFIWGQIFR